MLRPYRRRTEKAPDDEFRGCLFLLVAKRLAISAPIPAIETILYSVAATM